MSKVRADRDICQGYANCVEEAPSVFETGEDGLVSVRRHEVHGDERALVENAVRMCPTSALTLVDDASTDPSPRGK